MAVVAYFICF